jgi:hypothetical protein
MAAVQLREVHRVGHLDFTRVDFVVMFLDEKNAERPDEIRRVTFALREVARHLRRVHRLRRTETAIRAQIINHRQRDHRHRQRQQL